VLEYQLCPRYNCVVVYDTTRKPIALDLIELLQTLEELIEKTEKLIQLAREVSNQ